MTKINTLAKQFMEAHKTRGGYVLFVEGEPCGWKNELRNPESEKPGTLAVSEGECWQATGGDNYNGAKQWERLKDGA